MNQSSSEQSEGEREKEIAQWVLSSAQVPGTDQLKEQLPGATLVTGDTLTFLDIEVSSRAPRSVAPDGPLPVRVLVQSEAGELEGEVLLWVTDGYLSALELAWYTDEAPTEWPSLDRLVAAWG